MNKNINKNPEHFSAPIEKDESLRRKLGKAFLGAFMFSQSAYMAITGAVEYKKSGEVPSVPQLVEGTLDYDKYVGKTILNIGGTAVEFILTDDKEVEPIMAESCTVLPDYLQKNELVSIHEEAIAGPAVDPYEAARSHDLNLPSPESVTESYVDIQNASSVAESSELLSNFTEREYGFPVVVDQQYLSTLDTIGQRNLIYDQANLVIDLALLPKELYEAIDLKQITITPLEDDVIGRYNHENEMILDPDGGLTINTVIHEIAHGKDKTACNGFINPAVASTNPAGFNYTNNYEEVPDAYNLPPDAFPWEYGATNSTEDSAVVAEYWMMGYLDIHNLTEGTPLYEKVLAVQHQFEELVPGIVGYVEEGLVPVLSSRTGGIYTPDHYQVIPIENISDTPIEQTGEQPIEPIIEPLIEPIIESDTDQPIIEPDTEPIIEPIG